MTGVPGVTGVVTEVVTEIVTGVATGVVTGVLQDEYVLATLGFDTAENEPWILC